MAGGGWRLKYKIFKTNPFFFVNPNPHPKQEADVNTKLRRTSNFALRWGLCFRFLCCSCFHFTFIAQQVERVQGAGIRLSICFLSTSDASCRRWYNEASAHVLNIAFLDLYCEERRLMLVSAYYVPCAFSLPGDAER